MLPKILNFIQQYLYVIIILFTFILPVLSKMWANMKKAHAEKARRDREAQMRLEELRMGKAEPVSQGAMMQSPQPVAMPQSQSDSKRSLQDIAAERERRLAANRSQNPVGTTTPLPPSKPGTRLIRLPGGIVIEVPDETPQAKQQPRPQPAQQQPRPKPQPQRAPARKQARQPQQQPQRVEQPMATRPPHDHSNPFDTGESTTHRLIADTGSVIEDSRLKSTRIKAAAAKVDLAFLSKPDRTELKRAFVMAEVLGQPKGAA